MRKLILITLILLSLLVALLTQGQQKVFGNDHPGDDYLTPETEPKISASDIIHLACGGVVRATSKVYLPAVYTDDAPVPLTQANAPACEPTVTPGVAVTSTVTVTQ